jgi:myo-inositol-1(or 4)-monophosphatase
MDNKNFEIIKELVFEAGKILLDFYNKKLEINFKGPRDLVTIADLTVEDFLKKHLQREFPLIQFIGEEGGLSTKEERCFIVDPLDGTTNFAHHYPAFCISLAYMEKEEILFGIIYDPLKEEMFFARKGEGAFLNSTKISVSEQRELKKSLLATGFPYSDIIMPRILNYFNHILPYCQGIRRGGSAALDLAYTACGRFDGFFELGLKPWDVAAGILILEEAGGKTTTPNGKKATPFSGEYVATNGKIHDQILDLISNAESQINFFKDYFTRIINVKN